MLYENHILWLLKLQRLSKSKDDGDSLKLRIHALDHFVHREISKKIQQEREMDDAEALLLNLPFKMKVHDVMEDTKAMDELTAKDKERIAKEAELEIEANFPSYFDEF
jgi:hypothetical protein